MNAACRNISVHSGLFHAYLSLFPTSLVTSNGSLSYSEENLRQLRICHPSSNDKNSVGETAVGGVVEISDGVPVPVGHARFSHVSARIAWNT